MSKRRHGMKTVFTALRQVIRFFAYFLFMILAVVAWSKLWIHGKSLSSLEYGEWVTLGILLAIAVGLMILSYRVKDEIDKA